MKRGSVVVIVVLAIGALLALTAVLYWKNPENAVRGTFTLFHSLVFRKKQEEAVKLTTPRVHYHGRDFAQREFMAMYASPKEKGPPTIGPCPSDAAHWRVLMMNESFCFVDLEGWKLHWVGEGDCSCAGVK